MAWKIVKKGYSRSPWRIVNGDGVEVASTCSKSGVLMPVCGQTKSEVEAWLLDRCEWYARCAQAGVIPVVYSPGWRNTAKLSNTAMGAKLRLLRQQAVDNGLELQSEENIVRELDGNYD